MADKENAQGGNFSPSLQCSTGLLSKSIEVFTSPIIAGTGVSTCYKISSLEYGVKTLVTFPVCQL